MFCSKKLNKVIHVLGHQDRIQYCDELADIFILPSILRGHQTSCWRPWLPRLH